MSLSGAEQGRIHQNSVAFAQKGPWEFLRVETCPEDETAAASFGGYCHICGQSLKAALVFVRNTRTGEEATIGQDCAVTLYDNILKLRAGLANARREVQARKAAQVRRRTAEEITEAKSLALAQLDRLVTHHPADFGRSFGADVARRLREGFLRTLSPAQDQLLDKLFAECLTDEQLAQAKAEAEVARIAREEALKAHLARFATELVALDEIAAHASATAWEVDFASDVARNLRAGEELTGAQERVLLKLRKKLLGFSPKRVKCLSCRSYFTPELGEGLVSGKLKLCGNCANRIDRQLGDGLEERLLAVKAGTATEEQVAWLGRILVAEEGGLTELGQLWLSAIPAVKAFYADEK
jgi:hypothetical protein